jgi:hypothetical protein
MFIFWKFNIFWNIFIHSVLNFEKLCNILFCNWINFIVIQENIFFIIMLNFFFEELFQKRTVYTTLVLCKKIQKLLRVKVRRIQIKHIWKIILSKFGWLMIKILDGEIVKIVDH